MPTRCNRLVFYYKTYCSFNMFRAPLCPSSGAQDLYRWLLPVVFGALVYRSSVWCGAVSYVSGLRDAALAASRKLWLRVCSLSHPAFKLPDLYYIAICGLSGLPYFAINGTIFRKKIIEYKMCVLVFSTNLVWNISHSIKKWAKYDIKRKLVFV